MKNTEQKTETLVQLLYRTYTYIANAREPKNGVGVELLAEVEKNYQKAINFVKSETPEDDELKRKVATEEVGVMLIGSTVQALAKAYIDIFVYKLPNYATDEYCDILYDDLLDSIMEAIKVIPCESVEDEIAKLKYMSVVLWYGEKLDGNNEDCKKILTDIIKGMEDRLKK